MSRLFGSILQKENVDNNKTQQHSNITGCKEQRKSFITNAANAPGKESEKLQGLQQELQRCQDVLQWFAEDEERQVKSLHFRMPSRHRQCTLEWHPPAIKNTIADATSHRGSASLRDSHVE